MTSEAKTFVILSSETTNHKKILEGFQYTFTKDFELIYFQEDEEFKEQLLDRIDTEDLIITIGNSATFFIRQHKNQPTIYSGVNYYRESLKYEQGNSCGVFSELSIELYFQHIKNLFPQVKKIITIYSAPTATQMMEQGLESEIKYGLLFKFFLIKDETEFQSVLDREITESDGIFLINDPILTEENFLYASKEASQKHKLLFTNLSNLTDLGAGFSLDTDDFELGKTTGILSNETIDKNIVCNFGPYTFPNRASLHINKEYLNQSGFTVSKELEIQLEVLKYLKMGKELYYRSKKKTAKNIFQYVLSLDPNQEEARNYVRIISNEGNESKISNHLANYNFHLQRKDYKSATIELQMIKKIDPLFPELDAKIQSIALAFSESKRSEAFHEETKKNHYKAIQLYNESLSLYPDNNQAKNELSQVRGRLLPTVDHLFEEGMQKYNERNYNQSKQIFENILLIDPNNKKTKEFLRLSIEKKAALYKILNCKTDKGNPCSL